MEVNSRASSSYSINSFVHNEFEFDFVLLEEVECLSNWEFVDVLDAKNACVGSVNDELGSDLQSAVLPVNSVPVSLREFVVHDHCEKDNFDFGGSDNLEADDGVSFTNEDEDEDEDEDEEEDCVDVYDLDDELVPWSVTSKFERQRMRKLGKRQFPKMCSSRRSPHFLLRPGCVRGKHGLGLKYNY